MREGVRVTELQVRVARIFFELKASEGYVVSGGAALLASELIARPTQDLDLFASPSVASVGKATEALLNALAHRGFVVSVIHTVPNFCRLLVGDGTDELVVDLAIDSPPSGPPILTLLGPTLAPLELAGRKLLSLFGRAEARDFADVFVLAHRWDKETLVEQAALVDSGFDVRVLAQMMRSISRFLDDEIPLGDSEVASARTFFAVWSDELADGPP
jgi:hypothetical protein